MLEWLVCDSVSFKLCTLSLICSTQSRGFSQSRRSSSVQEGELDNSKNFIGSKGGLVTFEEYKGMSDEEKITKVFELRKIKTMMKTPKKIDNANIDFGCTPIFRKLETGDS